MLVEGLHYSCDANACRGSGETVTGFFKALQEAANRFLARGVIPVDGIITAVTLNGLQRLHELGVNPAPNSLSDVAKYALMYKAQLDAATPGAEPAMDITGAAQQLASSCRNDRNSEVCSKVKLLCANNPAALGEICEASKRPATWPWWVLGGVLAVGVGAGAYVFVRSRSRTRSRT